MPNGYFGVNSTAREVKKIYIGQNSTASQVKKAYIGDENGIARLWYQDIVPISELPVGSVVKGIYGNEEFIIVHQGNPDTNKYLSDCTGTWIMSKNCIALKQYHSKVVSLFASSDIATWLNGDFYNQLTIKDYVKQVTIPYYDDSDLFTRENGVATRVFLLSAVEAGFYNARYDSSDTSIFDGDGAKLDYFDRTNDASSKRIATYGGNAVEWWMRTPRSSTIYDSSQCVKPQTNGAYGRGWTNESHGIRPVMVLPNDILVDSSNTILPQTINSYLREYTVGDTVKIDVNGQKLTWRIVHKGNPDTSMYHESCNGIWLLLDDIYTKKETRYYGYADNAIDEYVNKTFYNLIGTDSNVKDFIKRVIIPYVEVYESSDDSYSYRIKTGSNGLSRKVFIPSAKELGYSSYNKDGSTLDFYSNTTSGVKTFDGEASSYWTRTANNSHYMGYITSLGRLDSIGLSMYSTSSKLGVLPCVVMNEMAMVKDGVIIGVE